MSCKDIRLFSRLCLFFLFSWGWMHLVGFSFFNFYSCYSFRDVNLPLFGGIPLFFLLSTFLKMIFRFFFIKSPTKTNKKKSRFLTLQSRESSKSCGKQSWFLFLVKVRKDGISTRHSKSDTHSHAAGYVKENRPLQCGPRWWSSGGMTERLEMIATEPVVYFDHPTPAFAPPPFPPPLPSRSLYTHTHTHSHTFTHPTHRVEFSHPSSHLKSLSVSVSLSLTHTHTHTHTLSLSLSHSLSHTHRGVFTPSHPNTRAQLPVMSSEQAKNSMTRNSPYFNPSPFPRVPRFFTPTPPSPQLFRSPVRHCTITTTGNRQQFF